MKARRWAICHAATWGLAILVVAAPAHAYRPFDGTDADVSDFHEVELEIGPVGYLRQQHDSGVIAPALIINYGFLPRWEVVLQGTGIYGAASSPRFVDGGVFLKHVLREGILQGKTGISLASEVGVLLPTFGPPEPVDNTGVYMGFIASYKWPLFMMHLNVALSRNTDAQPDVFVSTILEGVPDARVRPVAELYIEREAGSTIPSALVGFIGRACESFTFDAATRIGWFQGAPLFEVRAGFTWSFGGTRLTRT